MHFTRDTIFEGKELFARFGDSQKETLMFYKRCKSDIKELEGTTYKCLFILFTRLF